MHIMNQNKFDDCNKQWGQVDEEKTSVIVSAVTSFALKMESSKGLMKHMKTITTRSL